MASAATTKSEEPIVEVNYTNGKHFQKVSRTYGECLAIQHSGVVWISDMQLPMSSLCNYYSDPKCESPTRLPTLQMPGKYTLDNVNQYNKCITLI